MISKRDFRVSASLQTALLEVVTLTSISTLLDLSSGAHDVLPIGGMRSDIVNRLHQRLILFMKQVTHIASSNHDNPDVTPTRMGTFQPCDRFNDAYPICFCDYKSFRQEIYHSHHLIPFHFLSRHHALCKSQQTSATYL